uniref:Uncharacterized protein n=1 Tax=Monopterus albus TaxID=43700 RepID=A0A3Q3Q4Q2_MONAL
MYRGAHINGSAGSQRMKTSHFPKSMMSTPFLQHPALTAGQRRCLCNLVNVYSTEHMRRQMKQHYHNILQVCVCSGGCQHLKHKLTTTNHFIMDPEKVVETRANPQGQRKSSSTANSNVTFPKIVNRGPL